MKKVVADFVPVWKPQNIKIPDTLIYTKFETQQHVLNLYRVIARLENRVAALEEQRDKALQAKIAKNEANIRLLNAQIDWNNKLLNFHGTQAYLWEDM